MTQRFVILQHDHPWLHWDLLLEEQSFARTWRLLRKPCLGEPIAAEALSDHRLLYLDYEGPVSEGRGNVKRFLAGSYEPISGQPDVLAFALSDNNMAQSALIRTLKDGRTFVTFA